MEIILILLAALILFIILISMQNKLEELENKLERVNKENDTFRRTQQSLNDKTTHFINKELGSLFMGLEDGLKERISLLEYRTEAHSKGLESAHKGIFLLNSFVKIDKKPMKKEDKKEVKKTESKKKVIKNEKPDFTKTIIKK